MRVPPKRQGFAIILAVAMLALAGAAMVVLTRQLGYEVTRTRLTVTDAQLRQLLVAGARDAVARAREWAEEANASEWRIELPRPLQEHGAVLTLQSRPLSTTAVEIRVDAGMDDRKASQLLHFTKSGDGWVLTDAELGK